MSMTDPIADMLTRIRNACGAKHRRVDMPASKMKVEIARILKEHSLISDFTTIDSEEGSGRKLLRVRLKYAGGQPVIRQLQRVSTPGLRKWAAHISSLAFATMIFNYYVVNLLIVGKHSYAGVKVASALSALH